MYSCVCEMEFLNSDLVFDIIDKRCNQINVFETGFDFKSAVQINTV